MGNSSGKSAAKAPHLDGLSEMDEDESTQFVIDTTSTIKPGDEAAPSTQVYQKPESVRGIIRTALKRNFIFQTMEPAALEKLIDIFRPVTCKLGENIIEQGQTGDYMYAIESGTFDVLKQGGGKIAEMGPGQTFGELALLYGAKRSATVTCTKAASLWALDRSTFRFYQTSNERRMQDMAVEVLKQVPLLKDLDGEQLQKVADVATTADYREGDPIIRKGEIGNTFFIVLEGVVVCTDASLSDKGDDAKEAAAATAASSSSPPPPALSRQKTDEMLHPVSSPKEKAAGIRLKAGEWFGEIALLTGSARTANVMADSSVRLLAFDRDAFEKVLGSLKDLLDKKANMRMLTAVPIIAKLPDRERNAAFEMFDTEEFKAGTVIVREGTAGTKFYLVRSGTGKVTRQKGSKGGGGGAGQKPPPQQAQQTQAGAVQGSTRAMPPETHDAEVFESLSSFDMAASSKKASAAAPAPAASDTNPLLDEVEVLGEIKMGDHFGEESLENDTPRFATVTAVTDMSCFVLEQADFEAILHEYEQATTVGDGRAESGREQDLGDDAAGHAAKKRQPASHRGSFIPGSQAQVSPTEPAAGGGGGGGGGGKGKGATEPSGPPPQAPPKVELEVDWGALKNLGKIGAGTFGTVLMMQDTRDNAVFAMKVLDRKRVRKMRQERRLETEKLLLRAMRSPFICRLMADTEDESAFYLLMEMVQGGELQRLIHPSDPVKRAKQQADVERGMLAGIPHQSAKFYAAAISLPLVYVHRRMVAFRDLKPENVMIDRFGYPKLIDFGLAKPLEQTGGKTYTLCGTPEYLAPEVILGTGHNQAVDWWALGVLLFEMVVGSSPFLEKGVDRRKQDHMVIFENIVDNRVTYPRDMEAGCRDLIKRLLAGKPVTRLGSGRRTHKEYEEHLWFAGAVDWGLLARRQLQPPWYPPLRNNTDKACFKKENR